MADKDAGMKFTVRPEGRSVVLPAPALNVMGAGVVVAKALDGGITLYPMTKW